MILEDLSGERLDLVKVGLWGLEDMYEYSQIPQFYAFMEGSHHTSMSQTRAYLNGLIQRTENGPDCFWFLALRAEKKVIGSIGLRFYDEARKSTAIGYGLSPLYQGKGYMREAMLLLLDYLFNARGIFRVFAYTTVENKASIRLLEQLGFCTEGTLRAFYVYPERRGDAAVLSLLKPEYDALKGRARMPSVG